MLYVYYDYQICYCFGKVTQIYLEMVVYICALRDVEVQTVIGMCILFRRR